jgi:hypothetical protein
LSHSGSQTFSVPPTAAGRCPPPNASPCKPHNLQESCRSPQPSGPAGPQRRSPRRVSQGRAAFGRTVARRLLRPIRSPGRRSLPGSDEGDQPLRKQSSGSSRPSAQSAVKKAKPLVPKLEPGASKIRQRPTLPRGFPRSTIGSGGLNFRVRDGNGCDPSEIATGNFLIVWAWFNPDNLHTKVETILHESCDSFGSHRPWRR